MGYHPKFGLGTEINIYTYIKNKHRKEFPSNILKIVLEKISIIQKKLLNVRSCRVLQLFTSPRGAPLCTSILVLELNDKLSTRLLP